MEIITGYTGIEHVQSADDASLYRGIFGLDDYVLNVGSKLEANIVDNNTVRIMDGDVIIQGHQGRIRANDYNEVTIDNGTPGEQRNDLIVARYLKNTETGVESIKLEVVKGSPAVEATDPETIKEDLKIGGTQRDFALYRVSLDGINLKSVTSLFSTTPSLAAVEQNIDEHLADYTSLLAGGQAYQATLQNGWTHGGVPLRYSKDDLGYVTISGRIHAGNIEGSTVICTLPSGYRPRDFMVIPVYDLETGRGAITDLRINSSGALAVISNPESLIATSRLSINITYKGL